MTASEILWCGPKERQIFVSLLHHTKSDMQTQGCSDSNDDNVWFFTVNNEEEATEERASSLLRLCCDLGE